MGLLLFLIFNYLFFFNVREEEEKKVRLGKGLEIWNEIYNKKKKEKKRLTETESITVGRHKLLVGHNNSDGANNVHGPRPHIGH